MRPAHHLGSIPPAGSVAITAAAPQTELPAPIRIAVCLSRPSQRVPRNQASAKLNNQVDTVLLATAMAALGLTTHVSAIRDAGARPLILALVLFAWLVVGGAGINHAAEAMLR